MIKVTVGNNLGSKTVIVDTNDTLRYAFEKAEIDYARGVANLNGSSLTSGDLDKKFADFGIDKDCYLFSVIKTNNA